jgi:hypothetical protein
MKPLFQDIFAYVLAFIARIFTPALQRQIARLCMHLVNDIPDLDGAWVVAFADPLPSGRSRTRKIDASLQQFGRYVRGSGHVQGEPGDLFVYRGLIKRNAFYGTFRRADAHILAGTGTFVLQISANSRQLNGHCSWYDNFLDDVWSSSYSWNRNSAGGNGKAAAKGRHHFFNKRKGLARRNVQR